MAATAQQDVLSRPDGASGSRRLRSAVGDYFYFFMSLLVVAVVIYGFRFTIDDRLIHPVIRRPWILYVHAVVFSAWLPFFVLQSALVRSRKTQWHKRIGWFGVALGTLIPLVGVPTAIVMNRFNTAVFHVTDADSFLIIPLFDMACFTSTFPLAVWFRRKPGVHRRLILVATCALTAAAFGRFPEHILPGYLFYAGVDLLILLGVFRDLIVDRAVHRVYLFVLPAFIVGQAIATYIAYHSVPLWLKIAHFMVG